MLLQKTRLGWIVAGKTYDTKPTHNVLCHLSRDNLDNLVQRFWETEELPTQEILTSEEEECEAQFQKTVNRNAEGRYSVGLPFNARKKEIGDSYKIAERRFYSLERKLMTNPEMYQSYRDFLEEYQTLGHMTEVTNKGSLRTRRFGGV